jgi:hypothetical protein
MPFDDRSASLLASRPSSYRRADTLTLELHLPSFVTELTLASLPSYTMSNKKYYGRWLGITHCSVAEHRVNSTSHFTH